MDESRLGYIKPEDVFELVTENKAKKKFLIIDVRGNDLGDKVIKSAISIPSYNFRDTADSLASMYSSYDLVIVHCMMSHSRGPSCAYMLNFAFQNPKYKDSKTEIKVLSGGFEKFYDMYFDKDVFDTV
ncbi:hypothetical protein EIN_047390 [Entamoeba invadens IP1]|uniref:Rhodanese domain-containing protein n=1 Tax=Entamoeba invadens IP1 TaxID=370355 RepID=A0A0A1UDN0_ENTIV|nr:hypothetical protein EIN_047390 [Entamoeba invadens IP1]ELP94446.1 hypothetical protein EIN_047390 [Entamoeba invadens IP1]|eukprot:XP_004261217.1 hypothetical protein EIN_047390 [Entamoeba invadens IP1]